MQLSGLGGPFAFAYDPLLFHPEIVVPHPMADKLDTPASAPFALPSHAVVSLTGRDAVAFAQAQFANDVAGLAVGEWHWNAWLTPKGRVVAVFALLHRDEATLWMLLPDADAARALVASLQRFVFRSKVAIALRDELAISAAFAPPEAARGRQAALAATVELDMSGAGGARRLMVHDARPVDAGGVTDAGADAAQAAWTRADLAHGLPRLAGDQLDRWTPQQLGLDRLRAYSVHKGCYPGQEIVARTHFLGQAKRVAQLLTVDAPVHGGDAVVHGGVDVGGVCSVAAGGPTLVLAVLPVTLTEGSLLLGGAPAIPRPLLEGLAR